ncbi:MAG: RNA polymerase factor sigma-54, partial [Stenotrophomonas sp.]
MKARLQTSLGQQLVMTPQLRQAIKLLQMSSAELELEIAEAVETNPLLDWAENAEPTLDAAPGADERPPEVAERDNGGDSDAPPTGADDWAPGEGDWSSGSSGGSFDDDDNGTAAERVAETESLADHLLWQLHLSHLS